ncbi:MarR family winged helix-turn-helix transcriptional regulator [Apilactobacillus bombintestini]|uniref:MarR family transcriptional regulator n=1 Tax=Apilactobacillus bombintestini TaxID=2419772 RepID=A0A387ARV0_9LACO|nr:MarR family winged helix-turn-helix transcriptional regulator [Apilactobacillus bombintestini]AYF92099.1 MarR family transcriptional regulator [Apilactobacillus bombintestini]
MKEDLGRQVKIAGTQFVKKFDKFASQYNLTSTQMGVIDFLSYHPNEEMFQKDIEKEFYIRRSTASTLLQRMETKRLLKRVPSKIDGRLKQVILTDKALSYCDAITQFMDDNQRFIHQHFSDDEYESLLNSLDKLIKIMGD